LTTCIHQGRLQKFVHHSSTIRKKRFMDSNRHQQQKKPAEYSKPCLQYIGNLGDLTSGGSGRKRETAKSTTKKKRQRT